MIIYLFGEIMHKSMNLTNKLPPGKYAVAYHITSYKDGLSNTQDGLDKSKPKIIVIMPNVPLILFSFNYYSKN